MIIERVHCVVPVFIHNLSPFLTQAVRARATSTLASVCSTYPALIQPIGAHACMTLAGIDHPTSTTETFFAITPTTHLLQHTMLPAMRTPLHTPPPHEGVCLGATALLQHPAMAPLQLNEAGAACTAAALLASRAYTQQVEHAALGGLMLPWLLSFPQTQRGNVENHSMPVLLDALDSLLSSTTTPSSLPPRYALLVASIRWLCGQYTTPTSTITTALHIITSTNALPAERTLAMMVLVHMGPSVIAHTTSSSHTTTLQKQHAANLLNQFANAASHEGTLSASGEQATGMAALRQRLLAQGRDGLLATLAGSVVQQLTAWPPAGQAVAAVQAGTFVCLHAHVVWVLVRGGVLEAQAFAEVVEAAMGDNDKGRVHGAAEIVAGVLGGSVGEDVEWARRVLEKGARSNEHGDVWVAAARYALWRNGGSCEDAIIDAAVPSESSEDEPSWMLQRRLTMLQQLLQEQPSNTMLRRKAVTAATTLLATATTPGVRAPLAALLATLAVSEDNGEEQEDGECFVVVAAPATSLLHTVMTKIDDDQDPLPCMVITACCEQRAVMRLRYSVIMPVLAALLRLQDGASQSKQQQKEHLEAKTALALLRYVPLYSRRDVDSIVKAVASVVMQQTDDAWPQRAAGVVFLQSLVFRCAALINVHEVLSILMHATRDSSADVRAAACTTLAGMVVVFGDEVRGRMNANHSVLVAKALTTAYPYDVLPWTGEVLKGLSRMAAAHPGGGDTREVARSALREFARTHTMMGGEMIETHDAVHSYFV